MGARKALSILDTMSIVERAKGNSVKGARLGAKCLTFERHLAVFR